jgi:hypothetical protein
MRINTNQNKVALESIDYGSVVIYDSFHCIVVNGPFNKDARELPLVRLNDGKLLSAGKRQLLTVVGDAYLSTKVAD